MPRGGITHCEYSCFIHYMSYIKAKKSDCLHPLGYPNIKPCCSFHHSKHTIFKRLKHHEELLGCALLHTTFQFSRNRKRETNAPYTPQRNLGSTQPRYPTPQSQRNSATDKKHIEVNESFFENKDSKELQLTDKNGHSLLYWAYAKDVGTMHLVQYLQEKNIVFTQADHEAMGELISMILKSHDPGEKLVHLLTKNELDVKNIGIQVGFRDDENKYIPPLHLVVREFPKIDHSVLTRLADTILEKDPSSLARTNWEGKNAVQYAENSPFIANAEMVYYLRSKINTSGKKEKPEGRSKKNIMFAFAALSILGFISYSKYFQKSKKESSI